MTDAAGVAVMTDDGTPLGAASSRPAPPVGFGLSFAFGFGTIGVSLLLNTVTAYFPVMMATVLGQSTAVAGLLLTGSKLYDIAADVLIGAASDRTRSRWGRRRPYLLFGALLSGLSFIMLFSPPMASGPSLIIYMAAALVLYSTGYSLFNVPYLAMPAEMTSDYRARVKLFSFRTSFIAVAQLILAAVAFFVLQRARGDGGAFRVLGLVMAAATLASMLVTFFGTAKASFVDVAPKARTPELAGFRALVRNRPLFHLMAAKLALYLSISASGSCVVLFQLNVLKIGYIGQAYSSVVGSVTLFLSMFLWAPLSRAIGKKWTYVLACGLLGSVSLSWLLTGPGITVAEICLRAVCSGIAGGGVMLMGMSMLPDAMEYDRLTTGLRREGLFSGIYAITEKAAYAIGPAIIGLFLAAMGYVSTSKGHLVQQSPATIRALYLGVSGLPTGLLLISVLFILGFQVSEKSLAAMAQAKGQ